MKRVLGSLVVLATLVGCSAHGPAQRAVAAPRTMTEADCFQAVIEAGPPASANVVCSWLTTDQQDDVMVKIGSYLVKVASNG